MKAALLHKAALVENKPLEITEVACPEPDAQQLLIRINVCGICRTDLHVVEGELPLPHLPQIPGHQIVGTVAGIGGDVNEFMVGDRVGVAWLHHTCGSCGFCRAGRENLCERATFTGWTVAGGYAEYVIAEADFVYPIPSGFDDVQAAPLLCAGIIGYRALRLTGIDPASWAGARLGIYGFGAAGHVVIQLARARGAEVYVLTRDRARHQSLATELGAQWVGDSYDSPPVKLDASIIFAPAGELVPAALAALNKGAVLVLGGIHMSAIPEMTYDLLYGERVIRSVANNTRSDGRQFLLEAASIPIQTHTQQFSLAEANEALIALKNDAIKGAGVLVV